MLILFLEYLNYFKNIYHIILKTYIYFFRAIRIFMPHLGGVEKFSPIDQNKLIKSFLYLKQMMNGVKGISAQAVLYTTVSKVTKANRLIPKL